MYTFNGVEAITGACAHVTWVGGLVIGVVGGLQAPLVYRWVVDSLGVDDVCGVFAVHGSAGFIGTMMIPFFDIAGFSFNQLIMQVAGTVLIGTWTVLATMATMGAIDSTIGIRVSEDEENEGLDVSEHGMSSYPEFTEGGRDTSMGGLSEGGTTDD
jgi:Amt family ammonium transporter